jgi:NuA3 HAT complex component NTO1
MAPRHTSRRPGRSRRRPGSFARDETGHFLGAAPRSSIKPREERPYQEFHPDLDVSATLLVIASAQDFSSLPGPPSRPPSVLPQKRKAERPLTPVRSSSRHSFGRARGSTPLANGQDVVQTNGVNGTHGTPNGVSVTSAETAETAVMESSSQTLAPPPDDRSPLQILRQNFAASLPMSRAETNVTMTQEPEFEVIAPFKDTPYIGRSMADVGYQESEYWSRPEDSYIRFFGISPLLQELSLETTEKDLENRVEYDMDEQGLSSLMDGF